MSQMNYLEPTDQQLARLSTRSDRAQPVVMINLLRFREQAVYPEGVSQAPCSGREAYQRYASGVTPILAAIGADVRFLAAVVQMVIGPEDQRWDEAILVEYPSLDAFLGMVGSPEYLEIMAHRQAALADSRLIMTRAI